jgi:phage repressor protein C with HTH and peptisase S24 domain
MSNWDRLDKVIQYLGLNVNSFAKEIGLNRAERLYQIKRGNYAISKNLASIIVDRFSDINEAWLLTGEGEMITSSENFSKIPLYNISMDEFDADLSKLPVTDELEIPILAGSDFAFVNHGDSMEPEIDHGSVVFVKKIEKDMVVFGDIYLVVSERMNVVRFIRDHDANTWSLVPKNTKDFDAILWIKKM